MNVESAYGGVYVWLYDTLSEALACADAIESLFPSYEYSPSVIPVSIGGASCAGVITEVEWIGDQVIFRDRRYRTLCEHHDK